MRVRLTPVWLLALSASCCTGLTAADKTADQITVSSCPGQPPLPVSLEINCSHLKDAASKEQCRPFIENQACKVFPAYRKITGIKLEDTCKSIKFTIYEDENWPHPRGEGGLALNCAVDYQAKYSLLAHPKAKIGPYDVHELLHEYQIALGALPDAHVLFSSSMAEAMKEIGESDDYERAMKNMKEEAPRLQQELRDGKVAAGKQCTVAETQVEENIYIENSRSVYAFYRKLTPSKNPGMADRQARFNRMFYIVSGPKPEVRTLLTNYCGKF
ncbi:MAG TPA: hypothetical protein VKW06_11165 [Candidatus Angelobacter sp.]|nr:hypothetical protein [Candidatus Angelobacter sp.]